MRANLLRWFLVFVLGNNVLQLPAQQIEADRKLLADIRAKAEKGYPWLQCERGVCYVRGQGVGRDEVEAVKWCRKAAEESYALDQCKLGICYNEGLGVAKDEVEAVKWYRKAAEQNDAQAQYN